MDSFVVSAKSASYPIYFEVSFGNIPGAFEKAGFTNRKICFITDTTVSELYLKNLLDITASFSKKVDYCVFEAGEHSKTIETVKTFYDRFSYIGMDRKSVVVALGGGVTGDMAGFAAATYMRGIPYVQIPTTLLSQVDSSVGGKVAVDYAGQKNLIGAFYQPSFVYINTNVLQTLPFEQFSSGIAESIKHGFIYDKDYLDMIFSLKEQLRALEPEALKKLIFGSCKIKSQVVSMDERESGLREILNFGHTFGHAYESLSGYSIYHGHCVAIGMAKALYLSYKRGNINNEYINRYKILADNFSLPLNAEGFEPEVIYQKMTQDKKAKDDLINLVLLKAIGSAYTESACPKQEIMDAICSIL